MSGGICPGGICPGGICPGGICPGGICPGGICIIKGGKERETIHVCNIIRP